LLRARIQPSGTPRMSEITAAKNEDHSDKRIALMESGSANREISVLQGTRVSNAISGETIMNVAIDASALSLKLFGNFKAAIFH